METNNDKSYFCGCTGGGGPASLLLPVNLIRHVDVPAPLRLRKCLSTLQATHSEPMSAATQITKLKGECPLAL